METKLQTKGLLELCCLQNRSAELDIEEEKKDVGFEGNWLLGASLGPGNCFVLLPLGYVHLMNLLLSH
jgi:hypothetical protein